MDDTSMVSSNRGGGQGSQFPNGSVLHNHHHHLAFDEVQSHQLGNTNNNTMDLNELVKNVISVEDGRLVHQQQQNPSSSNSNSSSSSSSPPASSYCLGNLNLNGTLCKKKIDDVWKEIVHHEVVDNQQLGETTLEEFLLRAGVISLGNQNGVVVDHHHHHQQQHQSLMGIDPMIMVSQQAEWLQFQMNQQQQQMAAMDTNFNVSESVYHEKPPVVDIGYSENHQLGMTMPVPVIPATPSDSKGAAAGERKRRYSDEMMEKTIERRQKRMIKNRESAARSRARKQAYTNQLEHEVFQLRKTNSWLKKQKEVEKLLSSYQPPMPKYQLRRASSVEF